MMNIKKLIVVIACVVGFAPNNTWAECPCKQAQLAEENNEAWYIMDEQECSERNEPLVDFVKNYRSKGECEELPEYESRPGNVSFHKQIEPCSPYEEDPLASTEQQKREDEPYIIIYRVK